MTISAILEAAQRRAKENGLPYIGALLPSEAYALLQQAPGARLVDVRTRPEWDYVGRVPGAVQIEWQHYPTGQLNPDFLNDLQAQVDREALVMFLCRSGARSHAAGRTPQRSPTPSTRATATTLPTAKPVRSTALPGIARPGRSCAWTGLSRSAAAKSLRAWRQR